MQEIILSVCTGIIVGIIFAAFKLPIPAPPALAGVMGIVGVFLGFKIYQWVIPFITSGGS